MTRVAAAGASPDVDLGLLSEIQQRVLWLATRIVDYANHDRPNRDGIKVGGHQASSASLVTIMTALWFAHLRRGDRVSVKPHAAPILHAVHYLLGNLDAAYLRRLRAFGGLQAYPSRTKDPFPVDFSTGSVGLGAVAPLFAATVRRYVDAHFGARDASRFVALLGDAELDEGNVWEAIAEPATAGLGNVLWVVDLNRQSLDRVVPGIRAARWERMFAENGWHVVEVKYGARLTALFQRDGGDALRRRIDDMPNEEYQSLFSYSGEEFRKRLLAGAGDEAEAAVRHLDDGELAEAVRNLGGHDLAVLLDAFRAADAVTDRPTVVFAYTIKGWGLPIAGNPLNHSMLLTREQIDAFRSRVGLAPDEEWDRFPADSDAGRLCAATARRLGAPPAARHGERPGVPEGLDLRVRKPLSTQEAFGRLLTRLSRLPDVAGRVVTASPDVATSTNLAGWINRVGVFTPEQRSSWDAGEGPLRWSEHPGGQHLELGISEMNLFLLLGQLGLAGDLHGEPLLPIGTVYDPFVLRGLDAFVYALYTGARFVVVGTPSGITLAPEGGAHQSTITPSVGLELPGVTFAEPAYAGALDWLLCEGLRRLGDERGESTYLRLTTRPLAQEPFAAALDRLGEQRLRDDVLAGGYVLRDAAGVAGPLVHLVASGAVLPEVLAAADELASEGVAAQVIDVTSLDRLHRGWREALRAGVRGARPAADNHQVARLLAADPVAPIVTVHDAASHAMSWLGSVYGAPVVALGVDAFGQSGSIPEVYDANDLAAGAIVNAALLALDRSERGRAAGRR